MRKLAGLFALTTAIFAATTLYYRHLWSSERERLAAAKENVVARGVDSPSPRFVTPDTAAVETAESAPAKQDPSSQHVTTVTREQMPSADESKRREREFSRAYLEQLATPQARADLVGQMKVSMRQMYPRVDKVLGLTPEEHGRLLEIHAEEQVRLQEVRARCAVDPACDPRQASYDSAGIQREIAELLGPQREARWEAYRGSLGEREVVTQMRQRLPDTSRLDDDNAERLIMALADERGRIHQEASQVNGGINSYGFGAGMVFTTSSGSFESRLEAAQRYSDRLRERAALFLDSQQMRTFDELQDEQLMQLRAALRQKDLYTSASSQSAGGE